MIAYLLIDSTSNPHINVHSKLKYRMIGTGITNCDIPLSKFQTVFVVFACFAISKILKKFNVNPFIPVGIIVIASSIYLFIFLVQALMIKKGWV